ncbi:hypothetical protein CK203_053906 [Vitis vinifera]|uniref:Uncharacterized protein n=1 Tax=Vitis vinifera TaxID=29760 RepID=A0A438GSI1_VITVI|nr:hypothetical protein CK203_053906 [Vitis vinifera]
MFTRCSAARFKKLCNWLPRGKNTSHKRSLIWRRIEFSAQKHYPVTATDVGLIFGLPTEGRILQVTSTSSEHPFGTIRACEEKLLNLPLHYVIKFQIPSVQVPITVPPALAWTDDLIKRRLVAEIKDANYRHPEIPTVERTMELETNVDHDTNVNAENSDEIWHRYHDAERAIDQYQRGIQQQLRIMRGLMHKLGTRRHSGVNSNAGGHSSYAPANTPTVDDHAFPDGEKQPKGKVVPTNRNVRRRRVRRMAPNLLSPYISQHKPTICHQNRPITTAALVFGEDLDASEELVSMHDTILTRGNLGYFEGNG